MKIGPEVMADEELEWQKQMEHLLRREREKWKKYRGEKSRSFATQTSDLEEEKTSIKKKNTDNKVANGMIRKQTINNSPHGGRSREPDNDYASFEDRDRDRDQYKKASELLREKTFGKGQDISEASRMRSRELKEDSEPLGSRRI